jgi:hypothetical protein
MEWGFLGLTRSALKIGPWWFQNMTVPPFSFIYLFVYLFTYLFIFRCLWSSGKQYGWNDVWGSVSSTWQLMKLTVKETILSEAALKGLQFPLWGKPWHLSIPLPPKRCHHNQAEGEPPCTMPWLARKLFGASFLFLFLFFNNKSFLFNLTQCNLSLFLWVFLHTFTTVQHVCAWSPWARRGPNG